MAFISLNQSPVINSVVDLVKEGGDPNGVVNAAALINSLLKQGKIVDLGGPERTFNVGASLWLRNNSSLIGRGATLRFSGYTAVTGGKSLIWGLGYYGSSEDSLITASGAIRAKKAAQSAYGSEIRIVLNNQSGGLNYVTAATVAEAGNVLEGDIVSIACGKERQDADDTLPRVYRVARVTANGNATTGKIQLDWTIETSINGDGFESSGGKYYNATVMATSTSYTAETSAVYNPSDDSIYKATTSGTSTTNDTLTDTGVTWVRITGGLGSRWNTTVANTSLDGTPILTVFPSGCSSVNLRLSGFKITLADSFSPPSDCFAFSTKNCLDVIIEDVRILGRGKLGGIIGVGDATRNLIIKKIYGSDFSENSGNTHDRALNFYSCDAIVEDCEFTNTYSNTDTVASIMLEAYSRIKLNRIKISRAGTQSGSIGIVLAGCSELWLDNSYVSDFERPVVTLTNSITLSTDNQPQLFHQGLVHSMKGNTFRTSRSAGLRPLIIYGLEDYSMFKGNTYIFYDANDKFFKPSELIKISRDVVPVAEDNGTRFDLTKAWCEEFTNIDFSVANLYILDFSATFIPSSTPSGAWTVSPIRRDNDGGTSSNLMHGNASFQKVDLNSSGTYGKVRDGSGATNRLFDFATSPLIVPSFTIASSGMVSGSYNGVVSGSIIATANSRSLNDQIILRSSSFSNANSLPSRTPFYVAEIVNANNFKIGSLPTTPFDCTTGGGGTRTWSLYPGKIKATFVGLIDVGRT